jgi:hypothetical protein
MNAANAVEAWVIDRAAGMLLGIKGHLAVVEAAVDRVELSQLEIGVLSSGPTFKVAEGAARSLFW